MGTQFDIETSPRFVLSSYESEALRYPRVCFALAGPRRFEDRDDAMVARVDPPSPTGNWALHGDVTDPDLRSYLMLLARYPEASIWDLESSNLWARPVLVYRIRDWEALQAEEIVKEMLAGSEWAEVHRTVREVEEKVGRTHDVYKRSGPGFSF